jgi:hypothetical protein
LGRQVQCMALRKARVGEGGISGVRTGGESSGSTLKEKNRMLGGGQGREIVIQMAKERQAKSAAAMAISSVTICFTFCGNNRRG